MTCSFNNSLGVMPMKITEDNYLEQLKQHNEKALIDVIEVELESVVMDERELVISTLQTYKVKCKNIPNVGFAFLNRGGLKQARETFQKGIKEAKR